MPARPKRWRVPAVRVPSLRASSSAAAGVGSPPLFRALQVLIPSAAPFGALVRALEATRALAERGARIVLVPNGEGNDPTFLALVARFSWVGSKRRVAGRGTTGLTTGLTIGAVIGQPERLLTLFASPYVCIDTDAADSMMREVWRNGANVAVAPSFVGPDRRDISWLSTSGMPLALMATSERLVLGGGGPPAQVFGDTASLELRRLPGVKVLVPCPGDLPRASLTRKEYERLAT